MKNNTRLLWLLEHFSFEIGHDGISVLYRVHGHRRYYANRLDAVDAAIHEEGIIAISNQEKRRPREDVSPDAACAKGQVTLSEHIATSVRVMADDFVTDSVRIHLNNPNNSGA